MHTTKKNFDLFKKECQRWIDKFELNKYNFAYEFKDLGKSDARMNRQEDGMTATFALNIFIDWEGFDFGMSLTDYIKLKAKHEVIHLLIGRYTWQAESRYVNQSELDEAEEELVRKLEKIIK